MKKLFAVPIVLAFLAMVSFASFAAVPLAVDGVSYEVVDYDTDVPALALPAEVTALEQSSAHDPERSPLNSWFIWAGESAGTAAWFAGAYEVGWRYS